MIARDLGTVPDNAPAAVPLVMPHQKVLNTIPEAAALWSVSERTMHDLIKRGIVPVVRYGRRVLVPRSVLNEAWQQLEPEA